MGVVLLVDLVVGVGARDVLEPVGGGGESCGHDLGVLVGACVPGDVSVFVLWNKGGYFSVI